MGGAGVKAIRIGHVLVGLLNPQQAHTNFLRTENLNEFRICIGSPEPSLTEEFDGKTASVLLSWPASKQSLKLANRQFISSCRFSFINDISLKS